MPIKPENRGRYPKDWKQIRERILLRAGNRCEFCGVENHTMRLNPQDREGSKDYPHDCSPRPHSRTLRPRQSPGPMSEVP